MLTPTRTLALGAVLTALALGCTNRDDEIETETTPPRTQEADTVDMLPPDTMMGQDTMMGEGAGGTTINYEEGVATTPQGEETEIGGMTEGGVTVREGAAEGGAEEGAPE